MNEITRIITPCRCGKCIYCEFGGNPPAQIIEKETVCGDCERKDKLIEQLKLALKTLRKYPHTYKMTGRSSIVVDKDIEQCNAALLAAERGE